MANQNNQSGQGQNQDRDQNKNQSNFKNDPDRAAREGQKGGEASKGGRSE